MRPVRPSPSSIAISRSLCGRPARRRLLSAAFDELLSFSLMLANIPRVARACFALVARSDRGKQDSVLAWANHLLFDYNGAFSAGSYQLRLWPGRAAAPDGPTSQNSEDPAAPRLDLAFPLGERSLVYPLTLPPGRARAPSPPAGRR